MMKMKKVVKLKKKEKLKGFDHLPSFSQLFGHCRFVLAPFCRLFLIVIVARQVLGQESKE